MPETPDDVGRPSGSADLAEQSMTILASLHAAMVNFHLYPPTSDIVEDSVRRALDDLQKALSTWGNITFSELEGKLLINDFCPDDRDQARPNTVSFLKDLSMWEVRSITFDQGLTEEHLRDFLDIFSRKRSDRSLERNLASLLEERGIVNPRVDEKIYVSLSKDQEITDGTGGGAGAEAMDLLKDEVFVRYLVGTAPDVEVTQEEVSEMMSDAERINSAFQSAMFSFEQAGGAAVGPDKARAIRDTVNRMYSLVEKLQDEEVKEVLHDEIVNIMAALDAETLVEVLSEESPAAIRDVGTRREIISSVEGENVLLLTEQVIEKYERLLADRDNMDPQDYNDISSVLNEIVADIYQEGDPAYHPEITRRLRESGLLDVLARSHPEAGRDMEIYTIVTDICTSNSLRPLEGLSDEEVIGVAGKLLDMGEKEWAQKIISVSSRNLRSDRADFRARSCLFLKEMHLNFKERGHAAEIMDMSGELLRMLEEESDQEVKEGLLDLLGCIANDLFTQGRVEEFAGVCDILVSTAEQEEDERMKEAALKALAALNPWDVGRPLADSLYGENEDLSSLAARVLPYMEESLTAKEIIDNLKSDEEITITSQLAEVSASLGQPVLDALGELMESDVREEVYIRALQLLQNMGGSAAVSVVKAAVNNPIPSVRAQAYRSLARMAPGDPSLLSHYMQALSDDEVDVRREGARGLGTIDDPRSVDTLLSILQGKSLSGGEEHPRVEEAACLSLAKLAPEKAVGQISDLLRVKKFAIRRRTVHPRVKAAACYALGEIGGSEVVDVIHPYLDDSDPIVRNEARKAIGALRKRGYVD